MRENARVKRRRPSLAGQLLVLQVVIVLIVVIGVAVVTWVQNDVTFRRQESRRVLEVAETVAANQVVNVGLADGTLRGIPGVAEYAVSINGADYVLVTDARGEVAYSSFADDRGTVVERPGEGRQWVGVTTRDDSRAVEARVPVFDSTGEGAQLGSLTGYVIAGRRYPTVWQRLGATAPTLAAYLALASLVGFGGSLLLSRRIKRKTLGLEPDEIAGLVEHREAMLHGLREGVVGVDRNERVTLVNDEAMRLLDLERPPVGSRLAEVVLPPGLADVLSGRRGAEDLAVVSAGRVLVLNQMPVRVREQAVGWVTTIRDRTELVDLNRQLDVWRSTTDTLRSQAHEFSNRMHTVAGLIEIGEYEEAAHFVTALSSARADWVNRVTQRVHDPALAALLVAKDSRAGELGARLDLDETSWLPPVDDVLSADLVTVVGNLVDNALEALASASGDVVVSVHVEDSAVRVEVSDSGPGIPDDIAARVFDEGFSTKTHTEPGTRGWGLALSRVVCERRGGGIEMTRADGHTSFTAVLPGHVPAQEATT